MRPFTAFLLGLAFAGPAGAVELAVAPPPKVDINIVTAIDGSDSVTGPQMWLELAGLAAALRTPEVLAAIRAGPAGRIGFVAFLWHTARVPVVPWTLIASPEDAEGVARALERRLEISLDEEARKLSRYFIGRLTDLSGALDHAGDLLTAAPFPSGRAVVNVIGNGSDNMGEAATAARDRLLAAGATINGVVVGADAETFAYYRREVAGGRAAFVLPATAAGSLAEVMRMKLLGDLMAAAAPAIGHQ